MIINGTVSRTLSGGRHVDIPFFIETNTVTYSQWGHDTMTLGKNVDLLVEALRDAAARSPKRHPSRGPATSLTTRGWPGPPFSSGEVAPARPARPPDWPPHGGHQSVAPHL
ncbi:hypothetical protein [Mycobacterium riyadhense]|uniref:hypothetical protein n=1 Tax=Mycobacterium riyadhense TaxID=486698 RepID=UPI001956F84E|nr:hypothetical protein [Mycobacterium riyadhense]